MAKPHIKVTLGDKSSRRSANRYDTELRDMYKGWEGFDRKAYGDESMDNYIDIDPNDRRAKLYEAIAQRMAKANNMDLRDVHVRLGGTRFSDYYLGVLRNKRLSAIRRARYLAGAVALAPFVALSDYITNIQQADHYNANSNAVTLYHDNPGVLTHELGHAIDFNRRGKFMRVCRSYDDTMDIEQQANVQGGDSVRRAFKDDVIAYRAIQALRRRILPKAYKTYKDFYDVKPGSKYDDYGGGDERFKKYENMTYDELYNTLAERLLGPENSKTEESENISKAATYMFKRGFRKQGLFAPQLLSEGLNSRIGDGDEGTTASRFRRLQMCAARCGGLPQYLSLQARKKKKTPQQILVEELQATDPDYVNPFIKQDGDIDTEMEDSDFDYNPAENEDFAEDSYDYEVPESPYENKY